MEMIFQLQAPTALTSWIEPPLPTGNEAEWVPEQVWTWSKKSPLIAPAKKWTPLVEPITWSLYRVTYPGYEDGKERSEIF
jgi:hypothetical protein